MLSNFRKRLLLFVIVFTPLVLFYLNTPKLVHLTGQTMGTTYAIKAYTNQLTVPQKLQNKIEAVLITLNQEMSTYDKKSEISRFNHHISITPFAISSHFSQVIEDSKHIYTITEGVWDPSIKPLLDLWGFSEVKTNTFPTDTQIRTVSERIGFEKVTLKNNALIKQHPELSIDLSSIAKGYAVDIVAQLLKDNGIESGMVEIGGEVLAFGKHPNDKAWRIGINTPKSDASAEDTQEVITLENESMATSGDYRNFKLKDGKRYSHIINPVTGKPISHNVVSVTVITPTCAQADALATAIMVGGIPLAQKITTQNPNIRIILYEKNTSNQSLQRHTFS